MFFNSREASVSYEPYSGFVFPKDEVPVPIQSSGLFGVLQGKEVSLDDFNKLTKIPIVIYYGDNIATESTNIWNKNHWRSGLEMARLRAETINKHEGDAIVVHLPEIGVEGNTHFVFADLNNVQVTEVLANWLKEKISIKYQLIAKSTTIDN